MTLCVFQLDLDGVKDAVKPEDTDDEEEEEEDDSSEDEETGEQNNMESYDESDSDDDGDEQKGKKDDSDEDEEAGEENDMESDDESDSDGGEVSIIPCWSYLPMCTQFLKVACWSAHVNNNQPIQIMKYTEAQNLSNFVKQCTNFQVLI